MSDLIAYKNLVDGQKYVFAEERPDLDARPNFVKIDVDEVDPGTVDAALRAKAQAESIQQAAKTRESQQTVNGDDDQLPSEQAGGTLMSGSVDATGVFGVALSSDKPLGGVLSRGIVKSPYSRSELEQRALADSEALATAGVLASHLDGDLDQVELPERAQATVVSAKPPEENREAAKKTAAARNATKGVVKKNTTYATPKGGQATDAAEPRTDIDTSGPEPTRKGGGNTKG